MADTFAGTTALVTGASAGLGEEFARQLAARGVKRLALVARREDRLQKLRAELSGAARQVDIFPADLAKPESVTKLMADLDAAGLSPDVLINNAGLGDLGSFLSADPERIEAMMSVNMIALTRLTKWAIPAMTQRQRGWICNVGSTAGILPLPSFAVYAATKAYVNSFSEALRIELHHANVNVLALCPGPVETEFGQVASRPDGKRKFSVPAALAVSKEDVVTQTLDAMEHGRARLIPGLPVRISILLAETTPRFLMRAFFTATSGRFSPAES
jgi:short-subunit dehydrogenase